MPHEPSAESTEGTLDHTTNWPASGPDETIAPPVPELSRTEEVTHTPTDDQTDIVGESSATPGASSEALPRRFGAYALLSEVARGGMGVVYKARHQALGRVVALKMILEGRLTSAEAVQRFHQEARAAAALDHPNIVPVFDIGVQDGRHYFTMAFVEGASLKETVARDGVPSPAAAAALVRTIAEAIAAAHEAGIVHRDLKPENVLIDRDGRPRVTDFGLAKRDEGDTALTATGQILGTPAYMAPEQANGEVRKIGPRTDIYSLGGILYYVITGRAPFAGRLTEVLMQVGNEMPTPPHSINPNVPAALEAVCLRCMAKEPDDRYPTARALAAALSEAAESLPTTDLRIPPPGKGPFVAANPNAVQALGADTEPHIFADATTEVRPAAPRDRSRLLWLITGIAVLVGGGGLLLYRWIAPHPAPQGGAKVDPANDDNGRGGTTKDPAKGVRGPDPVREDAAARLAALEKSPRRRDFDLKVQMVGGRPADGDVIGVLEGEPVKFRVRVGKKAHVSVWSLESDGTIWKLFPNRKDTNDLFEAGEERVVPELSTVRAVPSMDVDRLWVIASEEPWEPLGGQQQGTLLRFSNERDRLAWADKVRGLRLEDGTAVSEARLRYKVTPRKPKEGP